MGKLYPKCTRWGRRSKNNPVNPGQAYPKRPRTTYIYSKKSPSYLHTIQNINSAAAAHSFANTALEKFNIASSRDEKRRIKMTLVQAANRAEVESQNPILTNRQRLELQKIADEYRHAYQSMLLPPKVNDYKEISHERRLDSRSTGIRLGGSRSMEIVHRAREPSDYISLRNTFETDAFKKKTLTFHLPYPSIFEEKISDYSKKLNVQEKPAIKIVNNQSRLARIRFIKEGDRVTKTVEINRNIFNVLKARNPELADKYLNYAVAHELAHAKQIETYGFDKAKYMSRFLIEEDADNQALKVTGMTKSELDKVISGLSHYS